MAAPLLPGPDSPAWGSVEWIISSLTVAIFTITGYIVRTRVRLSQNENDISMLKDEVDKLKDESKTAKEMLVRQPTREELRSDIQRLQDMLEVRFDQFGSRFDRLDSRVDSIINNKP